MERKASARLHRRFISFVLWMPAFTSAAFIFMVVLRSPAATLLALTVGILARCAGQFWNLRKVRISAKAAELAAFEFDGERVQCAFDNTAVLRCIRSWRLRAVAAIAACGACFAAEHLPLVEWNLLPAKISSAHWLSAAIAVAAPFLPIMIGVLFFWIKAPERRWTAQLKAAIQARAEESIRKIQALSEVDGLQAGIDVLWLRLGVERQGEYRAAITRRVQAHTAEAVIDPAKTLAMLSATTELARQDLAHLGATVERYHSIDCTLKTAEAVALEIRDPLREMRVEELRAECERLPRLALHRRWSDLQNHAAWIQGELARLQEQPGLRGASLPPVVLSPDNDPYRLLGVAADTPTPSIKKLRVRLAQLYHPDVSESLGNGVKMAEVNAAFDAVMKDRQKRIR
jgi:hypothetical protein